LGGSGIHLFDGGDVGDLPGVGPSGAEAITSEDPSAVANSDSGAGGFWHIATDSHLIADGRFRSKSGHSARVAGQSIGR